MLDSKWETASFEFGVYLSVCMYIYTVLAHARAIFRTNLNMFIKVKQVYIRLILNASFYCSNFLVISAYVLPYMSLHCFFIQKFSTPLAQTMLLIQLVSKFVASNPNSVSVVFQLTNKSKVTLYRFYTMILAILWPMTKFILFILKRL